mmetsp:Transcript_51123/g.91837  ORF Transcript_51123/g.91837 Transcript_51123/m.91837 type:complete len:178 (+) Transcript_51123:68-601(+)
MLPTAFLLLLLQEAAAWEDTALQADDECRETDCALEALQTSARSSGSTPGKVCDDAKELCQSETGHEKLLCASLEEAKCCIFAGGSARSCCMGRGETAILTRAPCNFGWLAAKEDATCKNNIETRCADCSGKGCELCKEEEMVKCCIGDGGAAKDCCNGVRWEISGKSFCNSTQATP